MTHLPAYTKIHQTENNLNFQANPPVGKRSFIHRIKFLLLRWMRLTNQPVIKLYHGYGNNRHMLIFGHVFQLSPLPGKRFRNNFWSNSFALLRSFMVQPMKKAIVRLNREGKWLYSHSEDDGFFKFEWQVMKEMPAGWHIVEVQLMQNRESNEVIASAAGSIYIPPPNRLGCISDIDDTFLISHSAIPFKKFFVLLTKNAHSRKPFEGVVQHYRLLSLADATPGAPNAFFYVSSSEWNLYDFILEFSKKNHLPEGIYLLNQLKRLREAWKTGGNKHATKFMRIVRILETFPEQRFILLGDSSQEDPAIYASVAEHFPKRIHAVYIRDVYSKNKKKVQDILIKLEASGVPCFFFRHSRDAIMHSQKLGLIAKKL